MSTWPILAGIPEVVKDKEAQRTFPPGADVSVACAEPPRASVLTVPLRVSSPPCLRSYPNVAAADPSGLLLLRATEPDGAGASSSPAVTYHLCDARTGEAACLRERDRPVGFRGGNSVGLVVRGGRCVVAELQPAGDGTDRATLLRYTVGEYKWVKNELAYSPPLRRDWSGEGVVSHGGMLWWADLSYGLLSCDPFADKPALRHVPLPTVLDGQLPTVDPATTSSSARRCVRVSGGRLRVPMADVWADESYVDAMLPGSIPALALLHPQDPDKLYFFLGPCIFAVDLRRRKVVESSQFVMQLLPLRPRMAVRSFKQSQEKEIAAQCSLNVIMPFSGTIAKEMKRIRDEFIREQQQDFRGGKLELALIKALGKGEEDKLPDIAYMNNFFIPLSVVNSLQPLRSKADPEMPNVARNC
ncbi:hypothetical protein C2845_PM05G03630 [Panicum miliaceum]|uniref:DUF1618 domain-containing protein n=1 Tax=Panicum miliaceum TaxID=4540 RepID=A0A3L6SYU0_PANMI|nr:hypothetical protein C2845_PM05G03630 [Panicum miliaceum]